MEPLIQLVWRVDRWLLTCSTVSYTHYYIHLDFNLKKVWFMLFLCVSYCSFLIRARYIWLLPVLHAHLDVLCLPACVPGTVCLYLQKTTLPQEDLGHLGKRCSTSEYSGLLKFYNMPLIVKQIWLQPLTSFNNLLMEKVSHSTLTDVFKRYKRCSCMFLNTTILPFQVISTMSCLAMWIPRAFMITDLTSNRWVFL